MMTFMVETVVKLTLAFWSGVAVGIVELLPGVRVRRIRRHR